MVIFTSLVILVGIAGLTKIALEV